MLAVLAPPQIARAPFTALDAALVACVAVVAIQLVPIPAVVRQAVSPAAVEFDRAMRVGAAADPSAARAQPLSLDPDATAWALVIVASAVVAFWCARRIFARGGVRRIARTTAWAGLVVSALAIVQHATAPTRIYWFFRPEAVSARPYGPFVNRNDLACWLAMAVPLTLGYGAARIASRRKTTGAIDVESAIDPTAAALAASLCVMIGALLVTQSRSGLTATIAGLLVFVLLSRARIDRGPRTWLVVAIVLVVAAATAYANVGALANRVGDALTEGVGTRRAIWRETWVMVRDFWTAGVGGGAFERGMLLYQTSPREDFYFNHAHNEYLQIAAEGGILLAVPVIVAVGAGIGAIAQRLRTERSPIYWVRAGAAGGLAAVAVQSVWETGLQLPANAVLFAVLAAIALHDSNAR